MAILPITMNKRTVWILLACFAALWVALVLWTLRSGTGHFFDGDAAGYHGGAVNLVRYGTYWFPDRPYTEREPLQSMWLAIVYLVAGIGNLPAVFFAQAVVLIFSALIFVTELRRHTNERIAFMTFGILLFFPAILHAVFSLNRELITLCVFLLFATVMLRTIRQGSTGKRAAIAGFLMGLMTLGYASNMLLPLFLIPFFFFIRMRWQNIALLLLCAFLPMGIWGARNYAHEGALCIAGCYRSNTAWGVRGQQAETLYGLDPLRCLAAEYITRDWSDLPDTCSFNAVMHRLWPKGLNLNERDGQIGAEGRKKILAHFPNYLWFSLFEVLELHLPFVNGWGRAYNLFAVAATFLLYLGVIFSLPFLKKLPPAALFLLAIFAYNTAIFALTDAIPRYLVPVLFVYAALSAIGYDWLLSRIFAWRRSVS